MSRIQVGVAYLLHRAGADELTEEAFVRQASLDLHWFSPSQGRRFLEAARTLGYLRPGAAPNTVRAAFDTGAVELPLDFRMGPDDLEGLPAAQEAQGLADELVAWVARERGWETERVWALVRAKEQAIFDTEVAALLVAGEAGLDVRPHAARLRRAQRGGATGAIDATSSASGSGPQS
jgi:hypothetical protein